MCPPSCARSKWPLQVVQVQGRGSSVRQGPE